MPQDLPNSQYIFVAVAALNTGAQLNMSQSDSINNRMVKFVISCKLKSPHFGISEIYKLLATCWYLSGVCALSSSRDIAQYRSNSPIYIAHKSTSVLYGKKHGIYLYLETAILSLLAPTGINERASFLVHQVPHTSATVLRYRQKITQFSLRV